MPIEDALAAPRASQRNSATTEAESAFVRLARGPGRSQPLGRALPRAGRRRDRRADRHRVQGPRRFRAVAEPNRRGGGSADGRQRQPVRKHRQQGAGVVDDGVRVRQLRSTANGPVATAATRTSSTRAQCDVARRVADHHGPLARPRRVGGARPRDRRQPPAVLVRRSRTRPARLEVVPDARRGRACSRAIGSRLPVTSESRNSSGARRQLVEQLDHPRRDRRAEVGRAQPRRRPRAAPSRPRPASSISDRRPPRRADRARSRGPCAPRTRPIDRPARRRPCTAPAASRSARACSTRRPLQQRAVDVEEQEEQAQRPEVGVRRQPQRERRDQLRRGLDVVELHHLDRRVHVAQRHRDDADGMPAREMWNASASVPVARAEAVTVNGMPSASAVSWSSSKTCGSSVEPRVSTAPVPNRWRPTSFSSSPGWSVANVTSTAIATSGLQRVRRRARAAEGDLLLRDRDRVDVTRRAARLGHQPRRLERHVAAEPVVHRARDEAVAGQLDRLAGDHRDVADPHQRGAPPRRRWRRCRCAGPSAAGPSCGPRPSCRWIGFLPTTPATTPERVAIATRWPTRIDRVPAADAREPEEPVVVDVVDDQPDLVDVADDRDRLAVAGAGHARDGGAHRVVRDLGERAPRPRGTPRRAPARNPTARPRSTACGGSLASPWRRRMLALPGLGSTPHGGAPQSRPHAGRA